MCMFVCVRDKRGFKSIYCYASDEGGRQKMSSRAHTSASLVKEITAWTDFEYVMHLCMDIVMSFHMLWLPYQHKDYFMQHICMCSSVHVWSVFLYAIPSESSCVQYDTQRTWVAESQMGSQVGMHAESQSGSTQCHSLPLSFTFSTHLDLPL